MIPVHLYAMGNEICYAHAGRVLELGLVNSFLLALPGAQSQ